MPAQEGTYNITLNAAALAVDQPDLAKPGLKALLEILVDNTGDIWGLKRMEIDGVPGRDLNGLAKRRSSFTG